jgi:hypothetical protein
MVVSANAFPVDLKLTGNSLIAAIVEASVRASARSARG